MRFIACFLAFIGSMIRDVLSLFIPKSVNAPAFEKIGDVMSQIPHVLSIFDKKPCSATGGTA